MPLTQGLSRAISGYQRVLVRQTVALSSVFHGDDGQGQMYIPVAVSKVKASFIKEK